MKDEERKAGFHFNKWQTRNNESVSGPGSTLRATVALRQFLPGLFQQYQVKRFLDAPCGDFNWMKEVDLSGVDYQGLDIVEDIVAHNRDKYGGEGVRFDVADICKDPLPDADMMMCRECLFHLRYADILEFFDNFARANVPLLLTTSDGVRVNTDIDEPGGFRMINLRRAPFHLSEPIAKLPDWRLNSPPGKKRLRYMCLWTKKQVAKAAERMRKNLNSVELVP